MTILGIETSCDETAAAIIKADQNHRLTLLSNVIATSLDLHAVTGGVIPENAAREQLKYIIPLIKQALDNTKLTLSDIDAFAITRGPGLIGSLLVGVETIKTMSFVLNIPIIPVNHMVGHVYANWIEQEGIEFPAVALVVSGGHTDLLLLKNHGEISLIGGTRDDAAGEAFDKTGRLLGLSYPAGPAIEKLAKKGNLNHFHFPRPLLHDKTFDFSFSGLKTAVMRQVMSIQNLDEHTVSDVCAGVQDAIVDVLVKKTIKAAKLYNVSQILLSGGVAANESLTQVFQQEINKQKLGLTLFCPSKKLCTDNAAMIAAAAYFNPIHVDWRQVRADPELYFSQAE